MTSPVIFLLLSILCSTGIFLIFRLTDKRGAGTFPVIVINYFVACMLGFILSWRTPRRAVPFPVPFYILALVIGILFILMFLVLGKSTQKAGMGITTIASKMSIIFPVSFSILYDTDDILSPVKLAGILVALPGVILTVFKKKKGVAGKSSLYLPLILFAGMGLVDTMVKLAQYSYIGEDNLPIFTAILFSISALVGMVICLVKKEYLAALCRKGVLFWGSCLGVVNYGSIYFLVSALDRHDPMKGGLDSSIVFGINNIGIVTFSVLIGMVLFREKLSHQNIAGILICMVAIVLLAYSA